MRIAGGDQQPIVAVLHQVGNPADLARHYGQARSERFGKDVSERLRGRWQGEEVGFAVAPSYHCAAEGAKEADLLGDAVMGGERLQGLPVRSIAGDVELETPSFQQGEGADEAAEPLALYQAGN